MNVVFPAQFFYLGSSFLGQPDLPTSRAITECRCQRRRKAWINTSSCLGSYPEFDVGSTKEINTEPRGPPCVGGTRLSASRRGLAYCFFLCFWLLQCFLRLKKTQFGRGSVMAEEVGFSGKFAGHTVHSLIFLALHVGQVLAVLFL